MKIRNIAALSLMATLALTGCPKKPVTKAKADTSATAPVADANGANGANGEEARKGLPDVKTQSLATVFFDLDAYTLSDTSKAILSANFAILRDNPDVTVRVEGHTDERGSTQYNLALGERRANSVKTFLTSMGIPTARLEVVSYGEEKPADAGHDESAWGKNRRVELTVTAGNDRVSSSK
jgi:peptidoglycan-associated lipoprotein